MDTDLSPESTITVITATYNASKTIGDLISSLRDQTEPFFDWIVIDGNSTDNTVQLLQNASDIVTLWRSEPDFGIYDALNKALHMTKSQYYLVVGSDDILYPNAIKNYRKAAQNTRHDIITASVEIRNKVVKSKNKAPWIYAQHAYISSHSVGALIKTDLHHKHGYYSKSFPIAADQLFIKNACKAGATLSQIDEVVGRLGTEGTSLIDTIGRYSEIFRVQLRTERKTKLIQLLIFFLKVIKNYNKI